MSAKTMKKLGITFMIIGIASYTLAIIVWFSFFVTIITGNGELIPMLYFIFAICCFTSGIGYGAIPLLIFAHRRKNHEAKTQNTNTATHCPYCGVKKAENSVYCIRCGNRLI